MFCLCCKYCICFYASFMDRIVYICSYCYFCYIHYVLYICCIACTYYRWFTCFICEMNFTRCIQFERYLCHVYCYLCDLHDIRGIRRI